MRYQVLLKGRPVARTRSEDDANTVATFVAVTHPGAPVGVVGPGVESWFKWSGDPADLQAAA